MLLRLPDDVRPEFGFQADIYSWPDRFQGPVDNADEVKRGEKTGDIIRQQLGRHGHSVPISGGDDDGCLGQLFFDLGNQRLGDLDLADRGSVQPDANRFVFVKLHIFHITKALPETLAMFARKANEHTGKRENDNEKEPAEELIQSI